VFVFKLWFAGILLVICGLKIHLKLGACYAAWVSVGIIFLPPEISAYKQLPRYFRGTFHITVT
jgi:hypothetical protein